METLNGLLSVEKTDIAYTVGENTYHVNIWNEVASAEIKYKTNDEDSIFKFHIATTCSSAALGMLSMSSDWQELNVPVQDIRN